MKYEALTVQCNWLEEGKGGFVSVRDKKRFEDVVTDYCLANNVEPIGGVSVTTHGTTILVTQAVYRKTP